MNTMIKSMLWMLLAVAVAANVFLGFAATGALHLVLSVLTGLVGLGAVVGLVAVHRTQRAHPAG
ncbi:hypothetical protein [Streptomyces sp. NPDC051561]|uniref:hypothetical protein n=1 Tax=Streptomyces sp. NPDC051561 TaxID=3365658 RepID=UPI0037AB44F9